MPVSVRHRPARPRPDRRRRLSYPPLGRACRRAHQPGLDHYHRSRAGRSIQDSQAGWTQAPFASWHKCSSRESNQIQAPAIATRTVLGPTASATMRAGPAAWQSSVPSRSPRTPRSTGVGLDARGGVNWRVTTAGRVWVERRLVVAPGRIACRAADVQSRVPVELRATFVPVRRTHDFAALFIRCVFWAGNALPGPLTARLSTPISDVPTKCEHQHEPGVDHHSLIQEGLKVSFRLPTICAHADL